MAFGNNGGSGVNYYPNSFGGFPEDESVSDYTCPIETIKAASFDRNAPGGGDHYPQPSDLFRLMDAKT